MRKLGLESLKPRARPQVSPGKPFVRLGPSASGTRALAVLSVVPFSYKAPAFWLSLQGSVYYWHIPGNIGKAVSLYSLHVDSNSERKSKSEEESLVV